MIIGMPRQLFDGQIDYEDGTPASTPQMANDVSNFISFMQRRTGHSYPDKQIRKWIFLFGFCLLFPFRYLRTTAYFRNLMSTRAELYAVRDHLGYKHWKTGLKSCKASSYRTNYWV
jgi:ubiquinol-cytochrome c reductase cytochrome c1 subunit